MDAKEASFGVVSVIVGARTVTSVFYLGVRAGTVTPELSGRDITLAASICRILPWFLVEVDWSHSVCVVVRDVVMLGLIYRGVIAITVNPGVSGRDILLATSSWRTGPCFFVAVGWIHRVWVVVMNVYMLELMFVRVR